MSQCVPNWDVDDAGPTRFDLRPHPSTSSSSTPYVPMLDYEMAELTWENGQLSMHGLGLRRLPGKPNQKYGEWERPRAAAAGTLESIVNLATQKPAAACAPSSSHCDDDVDLVPCFGGGRSNAQHHQLESGAGEAAAVDALVPCQAAGDKEGRRSVDPRSSLGVSTCVVSTRVDSCSGAAGTGACEPPTRAVEDGDARSVRTKARLVPRVPVAGDWSKDQSVSVSGTFAGDSWHVPTVDTSERVGFTSTTSFCSQGNTLSTSGRPSCTNNTTTVDDHDSVCHSRPQREKENEEERKKGNSKSASSNRRSRAAAIHNQSERKRRDKINQKMKTLQKLVPNSNKTDKASMLDEVIDYLKQLQAQVHMMSRMSIPSMMMPQLAIQQQLQMSMMAAAAAPMGMGMGFGMGMGMGMAAMPIPAGSIGMPDINMNHINLPPMAPRRAAAGGLPQPAFLPLAAAWDVNNNNAAAAHDRFPSAQPVAAAAAATAVVPTDPISTFLACQPQPVTVEAYSRMIAMIQQQQQQLTSTSKH